VDDDVELCEDDPMYEKIKECFKVICKCICISAFLKLK